MSVRVEKSCSTPRTVPGGFPQGSILGNFLFCTTTNVFTELRGNSTTVSSLSPSSTSSSSSSDGDAQLEPVAPTALYTVSTPSGHHNHLQIYQEVTNQIVILLTFSGLKDVMISIALLVKKSPNSWGTTN